MAWQTLDEWLSRHHQNPVKRTDTTVVLADFGGNEARRAELWRLSDYRVTSVTGGAIWLVRDRLPDGTAVSAEHQDDQMYTCPVCLAEMLDWQQGAHECQGKGGKV